MKINAQGERAIMLWLRSVSKHYGFTKANLIRFAMIAEANGRATGKPYIRLTESETKSGERQVLLLSKVAYD